VIYFIETQGLVKIGYSNDPRRRFHNLSIGCPTKCTLIGVIDGCMTDEKDIHEKFKENRVRGEWFEFTPEINALIAAKSAVVDTLSTDVQEEARHPLAQYLDANDIGVAEFAKMAGISRCQLWRIMNGDTTTVNTMFTIVEATNGDVSVDDFLEVWSAKRRLERAPESSLAIEYGTTASEAAA
jgi:transcriptional regulator with XRE-family HTH domain